MPSTTAPSPSDRRDSHEVGADQDQTTTRQRILDVAMGLFIDQGYDGTSLREIAEEVGVTKAALYYHFASKADIVVALLEPFEEIQARWVESVPDDPTDREWAESLGEVIDWMVENRAVFQLFDRNHEVFESLHGGDHKHQELHDRIGQLLGNPKVDSRRRIRMAAALGVSMAMAPMGDTPLDDLDPEQIRVELRAAVERVLGL